eukprot:CAMPEP_0183726252 /NCGR_PEP_ID=MMETSP0737-20130205/22870_1 /TAXON_ID=385413 /ORGANISM="Thalassiosira miniscula, Strain CCMP1093" /LENGTH=1250 /DNA_ID=CAMNT_0025957549 /DNA_START=32 /DNA_END=3784 /DNA_ORIENTATION=+
MSCKKFQVLPNITKLRLEAIFHPKFENERSNDASIRNRMLDNVSSQRGYLEASLKHSGSLLLWSGRQRFYSKNSTDNNFTRVGELLLMQHFARCFPSNEEERIGNNDGGSKDDAANTATESIACRWKEEYERCSEYIHQNRLTCSFEVVTSVLGHHGDLPKRDYLILIAVADRNGGGRFHSSNELARLAQKFRLPHNDAWMFASRRACESLFEAYDGMREEGLAGTVIGRLDQIVEHDEEGGCAKVHSLYPHDIFQGDILEGIVIRYVPYNNTPLVSSGTTTGESEATSAGKNDLNEMKELSNASKKLLQLVPPSRELDTSSSSVSLLHNDSDDSIIQRVDIRELAQMHDFEQQVENVLHSYHGANLRRINRWSEEAGTTSEGPSSEVAAKHINIVNIANDILASSSGKYDQETLKIAELIQTLDRLNIHASYRILTEHAAIPSSSIVGDGGDGEERQRRRCLCILHIHHDSSFAKYNAHLRREGSGGMMLFRGFSIELVCADDETDGKIDNPPDKSLDWNNSPMTTDGCEELNNNVNVDEEKLMLKMKFLPYMVRTFICRNGLSVLQTSGAAAFEHHAIGLLSRWQISDASTKKWMPFFGGWAKYCTTVATKSNALLPPLTAQTYLHHYNEFETRFANGEFQPSPPSLGPNSKFCGLVVVVGISKYELEDLARALSKELQCSKVVDDVNKITDKDLLMSMQRSRGGIVCMAEIEDGIGNLRKLAKEKQEAISVIMVEGNLETLSTSDRRLRKIKGMMQSWRKTKCNMLLDLPKDATMQLDLDATFAYLRMDATAMAVVAKLKEESNGHTPDERPGLIVYFPSIPGSGKSSLCKSITANTLGMSNDRSLILKEGDQVQGKFYNVVAKEILNKPASVAILDKNVPPSSFSAVHTLCIESKSIAMPVLSNGMQDTLVGVHVYPFSLPYLAVCMSRVLKRKPKSHNGKLDSGTKNACMVVVKFYCFYRNMTTDVLKEKLMNIGCQATKQLITPFFKENSLPSLPVDLESSLQEAINLQTSDDMNVCKTSDEMMNDVEKKLRVSILENQNYIDNLTTSLEESKAFFVSETSKAIASLPDQLDTTNQLTIPRSIKIASLDFDYGAVHGVIKDLKMKCPDLEKYFAHREEHKMNDENDKSQNRFITSVHCTFAHASQVSQASMLASFKHLLDTVLEVKATSIIFSDEIAAVELDIPHEASIPRPKNKFAHITIWCAKEIEAYQSNQLPEKVDMNAAKIIMFEQPVVMRGTFSFWYD